jgi:hypothetical protein
VELSLPTSRPSKGAQADVHAAAANLAGRTAKSMAAQLQEPRDPVEAIRPALEDLGAKLLVAAFRLASMTCSSCMRHPMI